jgi:hypothetical protein
MNIDLLKKLGHNWHDEIGCKITRYDVTPDAKVRTGNMRLDAVYHQFEKESGIVVHIEGSNHDVTGYDIVDDKKFAWFVLRWS